MMNMFLMTPPHFTHLGTGRITPRKGLILNCVAVAALLGLLSACGGGSGGWSNSASVANSSFTVGGTASGLWAEQIVLRNNGTDELTLLDDGEFKFTKKLNSGDRYNVTIKTQPAGFSRCVLEGATSGLVSAQVADIKVICQATGIVSEITPKTPIAGEFGTLKTDSKGEHFYLVADHDSAPDLVTQIKIADGGVGLSRGHEPISIINGLAISAKNDIYYTNQSDSAIFKDNIANWFTNPQPVQLASKKDGLDTPQEVVLSADEKTLYAVNTLGADDKRVLKIDMSSSPSGVTTAISIDPVIVFGEPEGIAIDTEGNIYIANTQRHNIIKVSATGKSELFAGSINGQSGAADGKGTAASFYLPIKIIFDSKTDMLYVTDHGNNMIRKISKSGRVGTVGGFTDAGLVNGNLTQARFKLPYGIAVDPIKTGVLYITDNFNKIRKIEK